MWRRRSNLRIRYFRRMALRIAGLAIGVAFLWIGSTINSHLKDYVADIIRQCGIAIIMAVSLNIVNGLTGQFSIGHAGFMSVGAFAGSSVTFFAGSRLTHSYAPAVRWLLLA